MNDCALGAVETKALLERKKDETLKKKKKRHQRVGIYSFNPL